MAGSNAKKQLIEGKTVKAYDEEGGQITVIFTDGSILKIETDYDANLYVPTKTR